MNRTYHYDHPEVYSAQPDNCINVKTFEFTDRKSWEDKELVTMYVPD